MGDLGSGEDGISPIPCGSGWRMGRYGRDHPIVEQSSNPQRISNNPQLWVGMENGKIWPRPPLSYLLAELESSLTWQRPIIVLHDKSLGLLRPHWLANWSHAC